MNNVIDIPLDINGIQIISGNINEMIRLLESRALLVFFRMKILEALNRISVERIRSINTEEDIQLSTYMAGNNAEIQDDVIYVYNNSVIDIDLSKFSDRRKIFNYPLQLSLAKIVEYGIGYTGMSTPQEGVDQEWEYDVNEHGVQGWYYKDSGGQFHWTNGYEGKLIFHTLDRYVQEHANSWIDEYLNMQMND